MNKRAFIAWTCIVVFLPGCMRIDMGSTRNTTSKLFYYNDIPWEISFELKIAAGYRPIEKYGKLNERLTNVKIHVFNYETEVFEIIDHRVSYGIDQMDKKFMIIKSAVPKKIVESTTDKLKYYIEYDFDGFYNRCPAIESRVIKNQNKEEMIYE